MPAKYNLSGLTLEMAKHAVNYALELHFLGGAVGDSHEKAKMKFLGAGLGTVMIRPVFKAIVTFKRTDEVNAEDFNQENYKQGLIDILESQKHGAGLKSLRGLIAWLISGVEPKTNEDCMQLVKDVCESIKELSYTTSEGYTSNGQVVQLEEFKPKDDEGKKEVNENDSQLSLQKKN